jgi:hypothetical protein
MTRDRNIDRILDDWFAEGPSSIADRVGDDALLTIEHTPQSGGAVRLPGRITMHGVPRFAAVAAAVVAVAAIGLALFNSPRADLGGPSASPPKSNPTVAQTSSAAPSPTDAPSVSPSQLLVSAGSGSWAVTGPMRHRRFYGETATLLQDGRVLVAGGEADTGANTASAELYDPSTDQWTDTDRMHTVRRGHIAARLADGRVLVAGGWDLGRGAWASAEMFDPASGTWTETGSMTRWRYAARAILLPDSRVLVAGGFISGGGDTKGAELYDPGSGTWHAARSMIAPPGAMALLPNGKVLVMHGGKVPPELYDPVSGRWTSTTSPGDTLFAYQATLLANGEVLVLSSAGDATDAAELYDPDSGTWTPTGRPLTGRGPTALLSDGTVLQFGAKGAARYDPGTGTWTSVAAPPEPNYWYDGGIAIRLLDGRVLAGPGALFDPAGTP